MNDGDKNKDCNLDLIVVANMISRHIKRRVVLRASRSFSTAEEPALTQIYGGLKDQVRHASHSVLV